MFIHIYSMCEFYFNNSTLFSFLQDLVAYKFDSVLLFL